MRKDFLIIEELVLTANEIGYDKTLEILKSSRNMIKDKDLVLQEFIINCVCKCYSVQKKELLSSKNKYTDARSVCAIILKKHLNYSQSKISGILRRDDSVISKYIKRISYLNDKNSDDKAIIIKISEVENQVREFKTKILNS